MSEHLITSGWGFVGKIPVKGDFIYNGLKKPFISTIQDWQQAVLAVSREQLLESWEQRFLNAPVWNFALDEATTGEHHHIGSMIPSVDSVGRYFFLTVARPVTGLLVDFWNNRAWSDSSQDLAIQVLDDSFDYQRWLENLDTPNDELEEMISANTTATIEHLDTAVLVNEESQLDAPQLLQSYLNSRFKSPCFWWTDGADTVAPTMIITDGLPAIGQFSAMLDGNWSQWGW